MKLRYIPIVALSALLTVGCGNDRKDSSSCEIMRLDRTLYSYKDMDSLKRERVIDSLRVQMTAVSQVLGLDTLSDESMLAWSSSMPVEVFSPMADTAFVDMSKYEKSLGETLKNAEKAKLNLRKRSYAAVVWGRPESIVFNDSVTLIALNHYLGADSPAYEHWPSYKRMLKRPDMLVYDILEATLATEYPFAPAENENTVLSHVLYEGALAYAKMQLIPDAKLANAIGLSESQLRDTEENMQYTWGKVAAEQMLYSTDPDLIERLFAQLPYSSPISAKAPGRCIRVLGYQIVQSYMKNNKGTTIEYLLSPDFYSSKQSLVKADYSPSHK